MSTLRTLASSVFAPLASKWSALFPSSGSLPGEQGQRIASDLAMQRAMRNAIFVDYERRALVATMREIDRKDGRVKMVHGRTASDVIRGGLVMQTASEVLKREWDSFQARLQLNNWEKLKSDDHPAKPAVRVVSPETGNTWGWRLKIGRFLPAWASRITLEIVSVRIERLCTAITPAWRTKPASHGAF